MDKHMPTPWYLGKDCGGCLCISDSNGAPETRYEICSHLDKANAVFIVRAVNMHQILIDTIKSLRDGFEQEISGDTCQNIDAIIAKAEGR